MQCSVVTARHWKVTSTSYISPVHYCFTNHNNISLWKMQKYLLLVCSAEGWQHFVSKHMRVNVGLVNCSARLSVLSYFIDIPTAQLCSFSSFLFTLAIALTQLCCSFLQSHSQRPSSGLSTKKSTNWLTVPTKIQTDYQKLFWQVSSPDCDTNDHKCYSILYWRQSGKRDRFDVWYSAWQYLLDVSVNGVWPVMSD